MSRSSTQPSPTFPSYLEQPPFPEPAAKPARPKSRMWTILVYFHAVIGFLGMVGLTTVVLLMAIGVNSLDAGTAPTETKVPSVSAPKAVAPVTPKAATPKTVELTSGQRNALRSGQSYIDTMPFSRAGLIAQLSSEYGEGYAKADATFAADHVTVDWNAEAVESAQSYLEIGGFSRTKLIEQLSSPYGGQFTKAQATYAADRVL